MPSISRNDNIFTEGYRLKFRRLFKNAYLAEFKSQRAMTSTFLTFQEYYESPNTDFRNKKFDKFVFKKWYKKKYKSDYCSDWWGFNAPDYVFLPFILGQMGKLDYYEQKLVKAVTNLQPKYYIMGALEGDSETIKHESAHGLFYMDSFYKQNVIGTIWQYDTKAIQEHLKEIGYEDEVMLDEIQAYVIADENYLTEKGLWNKDIAALSKKLNDIYARTRYTE